MTPADAQNLAHALAGIGRHVFPVAISWDDKKGATNKRPLNQHGHLDATTELEEVSRQFAGVTLRAGEELGVGWFPGPSGRVVLDVDDKHGLRGSDQLDALEAEHGKLPDHPIVHTSSGGTHRIFAKPEGMHVGNDDLAPGINVRADDGWVVAPGTTTSWGSWVLEEMTAGPPPLWPGWLASMLTGQPVANGKPSTGSQFAKPGKLAKGRWSKLKRDELDPRDLAALEALEALGGHGAYVGGDESVSITRPGKKAGTSATIGYLGPGTAKVFTDNWPKLEQNKVYEVDELEAIAAGEDPPDEGVPREHKASRAPSHWPDPEPLVPHRSEVAFPVAALGPTLGGYVEALAEATQTPPDMAATCVLATLAACCGGRAVVQARPGWREPTNLYAVPVMAPGSRKSAVIAAVTAPLYAVEKTLRAALGPRVGELNSLREIAGAQAAAARSKAANARPEQRDVLTAEAISLQASADAIEVPAMPRLLADDVTPEAVGGLLAEHGGRIAVISAEGGIFDVMAGRYAKGVPNLDVWLKGHSGDPLRIDRRSRPAEHVDQPAITMLLTVQPVVLAAIARNGSFSGRGLLARILFCIPAPNIGARRVGAPPVPEKVSAAYHRTVVELAEAMQEWRGDPAVLTLEPAAHAALLDFERWLEPRLAPTGELGGIVEWAAKLAGATVRIGGLLHLAAHGAEGYRTAVSVETFTAAEHMARYYLAHAKVAFAVLGQDPQTAAATDVLEHLGRHRVEQFSIRDLLTNLSRTRFATTDDVAAAVAVLEDAGWVRRLPTEPRQGPGRPPSPRYEVHPRCSPAQSAEYAESTSTGVSADTADSAGP